MEHTPHTPTPQPVLGAEAAALLEVLVAELRGMKREKELWDVGEVADFLRLRKSTVQQRIICKPGFPRPVELPSKRWFAAEVREWAKKQR